MDLWFYVFTLSVQLIYAVAIVKVSINFPPLFLFKLTFKTTCNYLLCVLLRNNFNLVYTEVNFRPAHDTATDTE